MFDRTKPHVLILSDVSDTIYIERSIGPYKVASILRDIGIDTFVIHYLGTFTITEIKNILNEFINENTLYVGINNFNYNMWMMNEINIKEMVPDVPNYFQSLRGAILPHGNQFNLEIKSIIKNKNPNCKLVLGGPKAVDLEENKIFDYVVVGYSEKSIENLTKHLLYGDTLYNSYKSVNGFYVIKDIQAEGYDFVNHSMHYVDHDCILENETLLLEFSRGCIFKCKFCGFPMNGKKKMDYIRNTDLVYNEMIENYEKYNVTRYLLVDDTFNDSIEKCKLIYDLSQKLPFQLEYWAYIRLDLLAAHPETIDILFKSGLRAAFYGIETLNTNTSIFINKGGSREKLIKTISDIKNRYGDNISQHGNFIFGLPKEDLASLQTTIDWLISSDNKLDTFDASPLIIRTPLSTSMSPFVSDIDKNWASYGYEYSKEQDHRDEIIFWKNEYTSFNEITELVEPLEGHVKKGNKIDGRRALILARYGNNLYTWLNKKIDQLDIKNLEELKLQSVNEYKQKLSLYLGIDFTVKHNFTNYLDFYLSNINQ